MDCGIRTRWPGGEKIKIQDLNISHALKCTKINEYQSGRLAFVMGNPGPQKMWAPGPVSTPPRNEHYGRLIELKEL